MPSRPQIRQVPIFLLTRSGGIRAVCPESRASNPFTQSTTSFNPAFRSIVGLPAEFRAGLRGIDHIGRVLARPLFHRSRRVLESHAEAIAHELHDVADCDAALWRKMVDVARPAAFEDELLAARHVADVDVRLHRPSAAVQFDRTAEFQVDGRARDDLEELLPRAVDVRGSHGDEREAELLVRRS